MANAHRTARTIAWAFLLLAPWLPAITGCSDDSTAETPFAYAEGDGVAELTAAPDLPASLSTSDTSMDAGFAVDSDTAALDVYLHEVGDQDTVYGYANNQTVIPGATTTITLTIVGELTAGDDYYVQLIACVATTPTCTFGSTFSADDTGYVDTEPTATGVYQRFSLEDGVRVDTGVAIPTVTAN